MSSNVVAFNLCLDTIDRTPQAVINANPGMFNATVFAPASAYVPVYMYTSLATIWLGTPTASSVFADRITVDLGTGSSDPRGSIVVITKRLTESVREKRYGFDSDLPGAVEADLEVFFNRPKVNLNPAAILNAAYRINYILDSTLRQARGLPPDLQIVQDPNNPFFDNTVLQNYYYRCFFDDFEVPVQTSSQTIAFCSSYNRVVGA